jgi:hypothetical protein
MLVIHRPHRPKEDAMNFLKRIEARDWMIAAVAFIGGAWIF